MNNRKHIITKPIKRDKPEENKLNFKNNDDIIIPKCKRVKSIDILKDNLTIDLSNKIHNIIVKIYFKDLIKNILLILKSNLNIFKNKEDKNKYLDKEINFIKSDEYLLQVKNNLKENITLLLNNEHNKHFDIIEEDINEIVIKSLKNNYNTYKQFIIDFILKLKQ